MFQLVHSHFATKFNACLPVLVVQYVESMPLNGVVRVIEFGIVVANIRLFIGSKDIAKFVL